MFNGIELTDNDLDAIRDLVSLVAQGAINKLSHELRDSDIPVTVYSMGENNPIIRVDLKRQVIK